MIGPWTPEYRQEPPFCIQLELVLGCNLRCDFCGINGGPAEGPNDGLRYLTTETADLIARRIAESGWNPRIELARRGEPTMHPDYVGVVRTLRRHNPNLQLQMTTNGGGLLRRPGAVENVRALFDAGLNVLAIDDYRRVNLARRVRDELGCVPPRDRRFTTALPTVEWFEFPTDLDGHPNHRYPIRSRRVTFLEDLETVKTGSRSPIVNHAGFGLPLKAYPKPCVKPFREVGINYDGSIDLCCIDWLSEYRIGTLVDRPLVDLWNDARFEAARRYLLRGRRDALRPCLGCDHPGFNTNWLPGKGGDGRAGYPEPSPTDRAVVAETLAAGPVLRPSVRAMTNVYPHLPDDLRAAWDQRREEPL